MMGIIKPQVQRGRLQSALWSYTFYSQATHAWLKPITHDCIRLLIRQVPNYAILACTVAFLFPRLPWTLCQSGRLRSLHCGESEGQWNCTGYFSGVPRTGILASATFLSGRTSQGAAHRRPSPLSSSAVAMQLHLQGMAMHREPKREPLRGTASSVVR